MIKSEEHKLDKLEQELLNIEKFAKNLDLNSKEDYRMILTNIVSETQNTSEDQREKDIITCLNNIKLNFLYRNIDSFSWQYCNKGFFNFKNYIPKIISTFN